MVFDMSTIISSETSVRVTDPYGLEGSFYWSAISAANMLTASGDFTTLYLAQPVSAIVWTGAPTASDSRYLGSSTTPRMVVSNTLKAFLGSNINPTYWNESASWPGNKIIHIGFYSHDSDIVSNSLSADIIPAEAEGDLYYKGNQIAHLSYNGRSVYAYYNGVRIWPHGPIAYHTLKVSATNNYGTVSPTSTVGASGDQVVLTATPNNGYAVAGWTVPTGDGTVSNSIFTFGSQDSTARVTFTSGVTASVSGIPGVTSMVSAYDLNDQFIQSASASESEGTSVIVPSGGMVRCIFSSNDTSYKGINVYYLANSASGVSGNAFTASGKAYDVLHGGPFVRAKINYWTASGTVDYKQDGYNNTYNTSYSRYGGCLIINYNNGVPSTALGRAVPSIYQATASSTGSNLWYTTPAAAGQSAYYFLSTVLHSAVQFGMTAVISCQSATVTSDSGYLMSAGMASYEHINSAKGATAYQSYKYNNNPYSTSRTFSQSYTDSGAVSMSAYMAYSSNIAVVPYGNPQNGAESEPKPIEWLASSVGRNAYTYRRIRNSETANNVMVAQWSASGIAP